jgi:hypothetical protein
MTTTKEKMVSLKKLAKDGNNNAFNRIRLAAEILDDRDFVESEWGDEFKAWDAIEEECFSMLRGLMPFSRLLQIYRRFPTEKQWLEYAYNLAVMDDLCRQAEVAEKPKEEKEKDLEFKIAQLEEQNALMREEVSVLSAENARLRLDLNALATSARGMLSRG